MANEANGMGHEPTWALMVGAATRAMQEAGIEAKRVPGRGRANVWEATVGGKKRIVSIRTTRDRWIAFPPLKKGSRWRTLSDVDLVVVAAVDDPEEPKKVEVYQFDATEVRERFDASRAARLKEGNIVRDAFGMWVALDEDTRGLPASVGSGLAAKYKPIRVYDIAQLAADSPADAGAGAVEAQPATIAAVMDWARQRIAALSGVNAQAVKLDLKIEC